MLSVFVMVNDFEIKATLSCENNTETSVAPIKINCQLTLHTHSEHSADNIIVDLARLDWRRIFTPSAELQLR